MLNDQGFGLSRGHKQLYPDFGSLFSSDLTHLQSDPVELVKGPL